MTTYSRHLTKALFYIVQRQTCNLQDLGSELYPLDINEYSTSKADLVIKRDRSHVKELVCCMVFPALLACNLAAMVAEIKIDDTTIYPIVEYVGGGSIDNNGCFKRWISCGTGYCIWCGGTGECL